MALRAPLLRPLVPRVHAGLLVLGLAGLGGAGVGCGPIRSSSTIVSASAELAAAETAQGRAMAPYELLAAEAYLHKAREEESYSDFEVAELLARKARDCARVARMRAERQTRKDLGVSEAGPKTEAQCYAGPPGARPAQGLDAPVAAAATTGATPSAAPAAQPTPSAIPKVDPGKKKPVKPEDDEPADPIPEGE